MTAPPAAATAMSAGPGRAARHVAALDGLRAVAIGLVLVSHVTIYAPHDAWLRQFALGCGATGVTLFFVLSGYLITTLLLREESRYGAVDMRAFYIRRALRLLPASYLYVGTIAVLAAAAVIAVPVHDLLASVLYVRNLVGRAHETGHLWSLAIEEQFYFAWPLLLLALAPRRRLGVAVGLVALLVAWRVVLVLSGHAPSAAALYTRTDLRIDNLLVGCVLALVLARPGAAIPPAWRRGWVGVATAALLVATGYVAEPHPLGGTIERTAVALAAMLVLVWVLASRDLPGTWVLRTPVAQWLGRLSYGIYLWQQLFLGPESPALPFRSSPVVGVALALLAAQLSYHLVERPFLRLKDRWAPDARHHVPPVGAEREAAA